MLTIQNLNISFDAKPIVTGLSLHIADGEVLCLRGESGSGKTSVLRAVLGFTDYQGTVTLDSQLLTPRNISTLRQQMAYVPQDFLMPCDTVSQMVQSILQLRANNSPSITHEALMTQWTHLGLSPSLYDQQARQLSGGQRQRIMLSLVGLLHKRLLLLDEPTSALDAESTRLVARYVRRLAHTQQMPVLAVSHSDLFAEMSDETMLLQQ